MDWPYAAIGCITHIHTPAPIETTIKREGPISIQFYSISFSIPISGPVCCGDDIYIYTYVVVLVLLEVVEADPLRHVGTLHSQYTAQTHSTGRQARQRGHT